MNRAGVVAVTYPPQLNPSQLGAYAGRVVVVPAGRDGLPGVASSRSLVGLIVRSECRIDAALLDLLPDLRFVIRAGSGLDGIDQPELLRRGVELVRNRLAGADAVAELAWAGLTALTRRLPVAMSMVRRGVHAKNELLGDSVTDLSIAVWGAGPVGRAVAQRAKRCSASRVSFVRPARFVDAAVYDLDAHVLCLPLVAETWHMFGAQFFDRVRRSRPYLCNMGRYELVDMAAARATLADDGLRGLYVDPVDPPHLGEVAKLVNELDGKNILFTLHQGAQRSDVRAHLDTWALAEALRRIDGIDAQPG